MPRLVLGLFLVALIAGPSAGQEPGWGTVKGRVVWAGDKLPPRPEVQVQIDKKECLAKGPILSEEYVIDKETKGVRWVLVWLVDAKDAKAKLPVHPELAKAPEKVSFDSPCCVFEPHILGVREGQTLAYHNSSSIVHNPTILGGLKNPQVGQIVPPGKPLEVPNLKAGSSPISITCTIHPWMKMYVRVFDHPYFAVTDAQGHFEIKNAPAGDYKIVVWHEAEGWVVGGKAGVPVKIEPGKTTEFPVKMQPKKAEPPKPTSHTKKDVEGWTVHVDDRLLDGPDKELGAKALRILANRLYDVAMVVPADKVARLRQVPIWLDRTHGGLHPAQYHPSAGWLRGNGYSTDLARCVHIPDAADFVSLGHQRVQPWSVLHELAHAYHDQVLGFDHAEVRAAFERFRDRGRYHKTLHIDGRETRHYALTDEKEFFAEMTEAFFGQNDFFPFNRGELKREEPELYKLLETIWGR